VIRTRLIEDLRKVDSHRRFAVYYPAYPDATEQPINLHAKVMIVDDRLVRIGSSNLNNRSMGLDTECDLAIEAHDDQEHVAAAIHAFRNRLLGEHLDVSPGQIDKAREREGSLIGAIEALRSSGRSLEPLEPRLKKSAYPVLSDTEIMDPERPVDSDALLRQFVPRQKSRSAGLRLVGWVLFMVALLGALASALAAYGLGALMGRRAVRLLAGDLNERFLWGRPLRWLLAHFGSAPAPLSYPAG